MAASSEKSEKRVETVQGLVVSTGGDKTCTVHDARMVKHPLYGKYLKRHSKYAVHDPSNEAGLGDTVDIIACRPISKRKRWRLSGVVRRAKMAN